MTSLYIFKSTEERDAFRKHLRRALAAEIVEEFDGQMELRSLRAICAMSVGDEPTASLGGLNICDILVDGELEGSPEIEKFLRQISPQTAAYGPEPKYVGLSDMLLSVPFPEGPLPDPWSGFMACCAMRYAFGAASYAPSVVARWIMDHWDAFGEVEQSKLLAEIRRLLDESESENDDPLYVQWHMLADWMEGRGAKPVLIAEGNKIGSFRRTCSACPSQWDAKTADGREVYIRYRWGYLSVRVAGEGRDAVSGKEVLGRQVGDAMDGMMDDNELKALLAAAELLDETDEWKEKKDA